MSTSTRKAASFKQAALPTQTTAKKTTRKSAGGDDIRAAMVAVVRLHVRGRLDADYEGTLDPRSATESEWTGSGFFYKVNGEEGYIVTNSHVARNSKEIMVQSMLTSYESFRAEVVGLVKSLEPDVALLKLPADELKRFKELSATGGIPTLEFADSSELERGTAIRAIGYPLGMSEPNISSGEVTNFEAGTQRSSEKIVTDAAINPGNSGGPSVLAGGRVIGLNTAVALEAANIGFITPANIVRNLIPALKNGDVDEISALGVALQKNSERNSEFLESSPLRGVIVSKVHPKGWAKEAGLKKWDVIYEINGQALDRYGILHQSADGRKRNIFDVLHETAEGDVIELKVSRFGEKLRVRAKAKGYPRSGKPGKSRSTGKSYISFGGLILQAASQELFEAIARAYGYDPLSNLDEGTEVPKKFVVVTHICHNMAAEDYGLHVGDIVKSVDGVSVKTLADIVSAVWSSRAQKSSRQKKKHLVVEMESGRFVAFNRAEVIKDWLQVRRVGDR